LHVTLLACRAAKQLFGLLLPKATLRLGGLALRRFVRVATATATPSSPTATPFLLLAQSELVVPLGLEIGRTHQDSLLVYRERRIQLTVVLALRRGERRLQVCEANVEQRTESKLVVFAVAQTAEGFECSLIRIGRDERRTEVVECSRILIARCDRVPKERRRLREL